MTAIYARLDALPLWLYAVALVLIYLGATWLHGWATRRALRTNIRANSAVQRWRRLTALETRGTAAITPEGREVLASDAPRVATDEEAAAIAIVRRCAASGQMVTSGEARHVLAALDRATAQRSRGPACDRGQFTATEDAPLGWVNVYPEGDTGSLYDTEAKARAVGGVTVIRTVPVYERPPRATARVSEDEIALAFDRAWHDRTGTPFRTALARELLPLFDRHTPPPQVVGACVVRDDVAHGVWTLRPQHYNESTAAAEAKEYGGTAHQLVLGARIGEGA